MINFAHGEVFMVGAFAGYFVAQSLESAGVLDSSPILIILILLVAAIAASMAVAVLLERVAYRPLRNAPRLVPLITAIGASLFLQYTVGELLRVGLHGLSADRRPPGHLDDPRLPDRASRRWWSSWPPW